MNIKDISIILLLYHTQENLIPNLKRYRGFRVLILDQSNDLKIKKKIEKFIPNLEYYSNKRGNTGFAKGINFLVKKVKTKYFLCTQPDIKIDRASIINLKKTFIGRKNCIISVPKIKDFKNYNKKNIKEIYPIKNIIGAVFLANKKKFSEIKMFDENFFFYWEDVDLSKRIDQSKYKIYINHRSNAIHSWTSTKLNFQSFFVKKSNFKFGELLYEYKNKKLRFIKIFRQLISFIILSVLYLIFFNIKKSFEKLFYLYGIIKFIFFITKSKIN